MKSPFVSFALAASFLLGLSACERKPMVVEKPVSDFATAETTRLTTSIDAYVATPNEATSAAVDSAFAALEGEIAELRQEGAENPNSEEVRAKIRELEGYIQRERARYVEARARAGINNIGDNSDSLGEDLGDAAKKAGDSIEKGARRVGDAVEDAVDNIRN